jgi:hypothetical protein
LRVEALDPASRPDPPPAAARALVLTDDFAPVEGLMNAAGRREGAADKER